MQLSKKEMVTAAFCAAAYAFLAVLILWGSLWSITVSCVGIGTFTNAVTALYFGRFAGRKSAVLAAAFALLVNTAFLILRVRGLYLPRADDPSTAEQVGALLLIALSGVGCIEASGDISTRSRALATYPKEKTKEDPI